MDPFSRQLQLVFFYSRSFSSTIYSVHSSWQVPDEKLWRYWHFNQSKTILFELLFVTNKDVLSALQKSNGIYQFSYTVKSHLHERLLCNAIRRFPMSENLSHRVVTHLRRDSLAVITFGKNRRHVSNTCDLWCQLYFARLDTRIVLTHDHLHKIDFNVSAVPGQSCACVNSKL